MKFIDDAIKESEKRMEDEHPDMISAELDDDLKPIIERSRAKIYVVGVGGAGNNTITRLNEIGIDHVGTIATNTDAQDLYYCQADEKILLGEKTCKGLGAGGYPSVGEECAEESEDEIKEKLEDADMVFIACGLGGGTGTGAAPVISKLAKKAGALTVAVVTMPFSTEGIHRRENAEKGLEKLQENADTVIVIPNDKLLEVANNLTITNAFFVLDEILGRAVKGITELITKPGLVALDFADVRSIMQGSGMAMIGMGESDSGDRAIESVHEAINSPLLDLDVSDAKGALINISGSSDLTLYESEKIVQIIADKLDPEANIIWGVQIDDALQNTIRTTIIVSGVNSQSSYIDERHEPLEVPETDSTPVKDPLTEFVDGIF
ncbi:MAG: cell division protein FtsZ [Methanobrevibacter sp.]|nr:cell division protein FtsZ [Methanobrevibacter sp.]